MEDIAYTLKHNAKAAASRMIINGTAPAPDFQIVAAHDGFRIEWVPATPTTAEPEERATTEAEAPTAAEPQMSERLANGKPDTALAKVRNLLRRPEGATIAEIQAVTGWLPHSARAFISVSVKRKAGLDVATEKVEGRGRVYRVAANAGQDDDSVR
jgi:hypothetical protein